MSPVLVAALLFAVLLAIAASMVWQEANRRPVMADPTYVLEDAVRFVYPRLSDAGHERLDIDDVRRVLEWELVYLQGITPRNTEPVPGARIAGGSEPAVEFIRRQAAAVGGHRYSRRDIAEVLSHEGAYLASIGAVGTPVEGA